MSSNSDNRTLAEIVSSFPPVPSALLAKVAEIPYGQRNKGNWENASHNVPQILIALDQIEQSPAGKAWGVKLAAVPGDYKNPTDTRYSAGCGGYLLEANALVEWFFQRSNLTESAPMASVNWANSYTSVSPGTYQETVCFTCNAVCRMLYAAQELRSKNEHKRVVKEQRLVAMENKIAELEGQIAALNLELKQVTAAGNSRTRAPTITCLMHLFSGYMMLGFTCTTCNAVPTEDDASPTTSDTACTQQPIVPTFNIAPHTDRLFDLTLEAQNWFLNQLDTRTVWVRATDPDSDDNHISWTKFPGAVEMGKSVVFSHGLHRFW